MGSAALILICLVACNRLDDQADAKSPLQQYQSLADNYEAAFQAFVKANREAKTESDRKAVLDHPGRNPRSFAPGFMALADKYPGSAAAENALIWVCSHTFAICECERAKRQLVRDHIQSNKLGPALGFQGHYSDYFEGTEEFFRKVLTESSHHDLRGLACYWLARHLRHKAEGVRAARKNPEFGKRLVPDPFKDVCGADWAARLRRLDPDGLEREADVLFERVAKFYADVPHNDKRRRPGSLGEVALAYLNERRNLAIGRHLRLREPTSTVDGFGWRTTEERWSSWTSGATSIAGCAARSTPKCGDWPSAFEIDRSRS